jgi:hypothetical protein
MKLPKLSLPVERAAGDRQPANAGSVAPQGCDIGCLISKAPQCIGKIISGDIPGAILCAGTAAAQCGCF